MLWPIRWHPYSMCFCLKSVRPNMFIMDNRQTERFYEVFHVECVTRWKPVGPSTKLMLSSIYSFTITWMEELQYLNGYRYRKIDVFMPTDCNRNDFTLTRIDRFRKCFAKIIMCNVCNIYALPEMDEQQAINGSRSLEQHQQRQSTNTSTNTSTITN